jgi:hypothetical protein
MSISEKRRAKDRRDIQKKQKEQENKSQYTVVESFDKFIQEQSAKTGRSVLEVTGEIFKDGFSVIEFDETQGKASLVFSSMGAQPIVAPEVSKYSEQNLKDFRDLRENFPPVGAGIEWHRDFTAGGGHVVQIDDPKDQHKIDMKISIENMEKEVFQDAMTVGMDSIVDIMLDTMFTEGLSAAEVVYGKEVEFDDYVERHESLSIPVIKNNKQENITTLVPVMKEPDWKELGGITRLKILDNAYTRLKVYRHPISGEVLFITLDEKATEGEFPYWTRDEKYRRQVIKFHPWEIFWLSCNRRGPNLKGVSLIQQVYPIAVMVKAIHDAIGKGFKRWANRKYFFITGTERRPWNKETQKRFLVSMKQMITHDYIGIPVPFGFDVKNIGGEDAVFEGKNVLDHLIGLISTGMQYPRDFLEVGKSQADDKAWIAWRVRYGRNQLQVRRAIEQQLWRRQIWCKFGKTYRIPKKGVSQADQEQRTVYIPKLEWRSEGKWLQQEELKMLTGMLNVANPVNPVLKIGIEKKMADTLGIGELDWDDTIRLTEINEETRVVDAERLEIEAKAKLEATKILDKDNKLVKLNQEQIENKLVPPEKPTAEPSKVPTEEELKRRFEARTEGGVSRTTKETDKENLGSLKSHPQKGIAKEQGTTRNPSAQSKVEETVDIESMINSRIEFSMEGIKEDIRRIVGELRARGEIKSQPPLELRITHETKPQEITIKSETLKSEPLKIDPLKVDITSKSEPVHVDATVEVKGIPDKINVESKSEVEVKGIPNKIEVETKSQPVDVNVKVETQTPQNIEETRQRESAEKVLIDKQIELTEKQKQVLEEAREETKEKKKVREKIEKELNQIGNEEDKNE